jgi:hypothetical protein
MAGTGRSLAVTGGILALLFVSGCSAGRTATQTPDSGASEVATTAVTGGPTLVDNASVPLGAEHVGVVRSVHRGLAAGDLGALQELYAGDDWAGQQELLAQPRVRHEVLTVLRTHPANLGEGYVYPGFSALGWSGPLDRADGEVLGVTPESLPEPTSSYDGYRTAFFLAPQDGGPLQWYGIDRLNGGMAAD